MIFVQFWLRDKILKYFRPNTRLNRAFLKWNVGIEYLIVDIN